jgi:hypothetical protein
MMAYLLWRPILTANREISRSGILLDCNEWRTKDFDELSSSENPPSGEEIDSNAGGHMSHSPILPILLVISIVSLAGCELVGDIFKAGVWVGVILVIGIIGLVIWMLSKRGS